jgi:glucans biosynthesis protein
VFSSFTSRIKISALAPVLCIASLVSALAPASANAFAFFDVMKEARALAQDSYKPPQPNLPDALKELKFAGYQQVKYRNDRFHWGETGLKFNLSFYHEGMHFDTPVKINEVDNEGVHEIPFNPDDFDYGTLKLDPTALKKLGFAGFRVLFPVNSESKPEDELATFLGASYFRVIGKGQVYGLSARGLAIDTAQPSGEEFPHFKEYWVARPAPGDKQIVIYALLDSPRAAGAYRFTIRPGVDTVVDVKTRIFLRDKVARLGVAPLTSMFLYGSNQPWPTPNYRPEMHDSDGLAIRTGTDEWLWRPLNNPKKLATSAFTLENPKGFGLLQRGREFSRYEDLDDHYEKRPSLWIEPQGDWGKGSVQLVEIPTRDETNDNIVAFWVPDVQPTKDTPLDLDYRMTWTLNEAATHKTPLATVLQTRRSREESKGADLIRRWDGSIAYVIDFVGDELKKLPADAVVQAQTWVDGNGELVETNVRPNEVTGGRRLTLRVKVKDPNKPVEMRAALTDGTKPITETWTYRLPVNEADAQ